MEIDRPALVKRLDEASEHRLSIVSAGPGWGKTTSVAGWVRGRAARGGPPVAWISVEEDDNDPATFWSVLLGAVTACGAVPEGHQLLSLSPASGVSEEVLLTLFRGLDGLADPLLIVVDDFHRITDADVLAAVDDLIAHNRSVRLMLLVRFDPPLPLHRLRIAGDLAEIRNEDLAFDASAVESLTAAVESIDLTPGQVEQVLVRTEGWPAGVRLAALHLARSGDPRDLDTFGGADRSVAEYLAAEVLARHPPDMTAFLTRTSVAEPISVGLAEAIVPDGQALARLDQLQRANEFVVSVDSTGTEFRYHPLLRDMLLHLLRRDDPVAFREAHRAAARWLVLQGDPVRALHHAIAAEDWDLAAEVFVEASPSLVGTDRGRLSRLLQGIPFTSLPASAGTELCAAGLSFTSGHLEAVEERVAEVRRRVAEGDDLSALGMALLENHACVAARFRGDAEAALMTSSAALSHVSRARPSRAADGLRLIATAQNAVASLRSGDTVMARARLTAAVRGASNGDVGLSVIGARATLAWCDLFDGHLERARSTAGEVVVEAARRGWTSMLQVRTAYVTLATCEELRGEPEVANQLVAAGHAAEVGGSEPWTTTALLLVRASIAVSQNRPHAARAALAEAVAAASTWPMSPTLKDAVIRVTADVALLTTDRDSLRTLAGPWQGVESRTALAARARLAAATGELAAAETSAGGVLRGEEPERLDDILAVVEAWIVRAEVAHATHRPGDAITAVGAAVALAGARGIVRPFVVTRSESIVSLLRRLSASGGQSPFVEDVLARMGPHGVHTQEPALLLEPLTERELAVLAELPTMSSNEEIAARFYVSVNTIKSHLKHLYRKLEVGNRREAVRRGRDLGLIGITR